MALSLQTATTEQVKTELPPARVPEKVPNLRIEKDQEGLRIIIQKRSLSKYITKARLLELLSKEPLPPAQEPRVSKKRQKVSSEESVQTPAQRIKKRVQKQLNKQGDKASTGSEAKFDNNSLGGSSEEAFNFDEEPKTTRKTRAQFNKKALDKRKPKKQSKRILEDSSDMQTSDDV
jgi:hypothetical protein